MARRVQDRDAQRERNRKARERRAAAKPKLTAAERRALGTVLPKEFPDPRGEPDKPGGGPASRVSGPQLKPQQNWRQGLERSKTPTGVRSPAKSKTGTAAERSVAGKNLTDRERVNQRRKAAGIKKAAPTAAPTAAPKKAAPPKAAPKAAAFSPPKRRSGEKMVQHRLRVQKARQAFNRKKRLSKKRS